MMHFKRPHLVAPFEGAAFDLVDHICSNSWCLCVGFSWRDLILLNDSTSEDSIAEFTVVRLHGGEAFEVESITFGWLDSRDDRQRIAEYLEELNARAHDPGCARLKINGHPDGHCYLCA